MSNRFVLLALVLGGIWWSAGPAPGEILVATDAVWKYLDNGSDQGTAWRATNYNDSAWASGAAPLGYGLGGESTVVSYGPDSNAVYVTTYFRHRFTVADPGAYSLVYLSLMRDDGAVVYLNGTEVLRANMPNDEDITYDLLAETHVGDVDGTRYHQFSLSPSLLVAGENVLAVEVHQVSETSDDLRFGLQLVATNPLIPSGATWRYFKGTSFPGATWTSNGFNDAAWLSGASGFGFSDGDDATVLSDMQNGYASVFTRKTFVVDDPATRANLLLRVDYDDGCIAYLNGVEVARRNLPAGTPSNTTLALVPHEASGGDLFSEPEPAELIPVSAALLVAGTNVLAVSGHNQTLSSSDFSLIVSLTADEVEASPFQKLGDLAGGVVASEAYGVATGGVVVGHSISAAGDEAFLWTSGGGLVSLGSIPGGSVSNSAYAVNADGTVVVGEGAGPNGATAFRWTSGGGMVDLGDLPDGITNSAAAGVSADGTVVVGTGNSASGEEAFRWTNGVLEALGDLAGGDYASRAHAVSADGAVVVGESSSEASGSGFVEAFRWTTGVGLTGLGDLSGGLTNSAAWGVSADGAVVVGEGASADGAEAMRWTAASGMVGLGDLAGGAYSSRAFAVSADGGTVVGTATDAGGPAAFIWDATHGLRSLVEVLTNDFGIAVSAFRPTHATAISPDGLHLAGYGTNGMGQTSAWYVLIPDAVGPVLAVSSPPDLTTTNDPVISVTGTALDAGSGVTNVTVNGVTASTANAFTNWSIAVGLVPGTNTFTVIASDAILPANVVTNILRVIYVDDAAPVLVIDSPVDLSTITTAVVTVSGTADDPGSGVAGVMVNGGAAVTANAYTNWSVAVGGLTEGTNTLTAIATDSAFPANVSTSIVQIIVQDATAPDLAVLSPADYAVSTNGSVQVTGTAVDDLTGVESLTVNGIAATSSDLFTNWTATVPGLALGTNLVTVIATDASEAANAQTATVHVVYVDATPPELSVTSPADGATTTVAQVTVTGTAADGLTGVQDVYVNGVLADTGDAYSNWTATVTGLALGSNTLLAVARDNAAPPNVASGTVVVLYLDQTAPQLTIDAPADLSTTTVSSVVLTGTALDDAAGVASLTVNGVAATTSDLYTNWSATVSGLVLGTNTLLAIATDAAEPANTASNTIRVLYVDGVAPLLAITAPADLAYTTNDAVTVMGTAEDPSTGIQGVTINGLAATTSDLYTNWSAVVTGLAVGTNTLTAVATDKDLPANMTSNAVRVIYAAGAFDGDGNGLPDAWEIQYFGGIGVDPDADEDGDGLSNLAELLGGTSPTDRNSGLAVQSISVLPDGVLSLSWSSVSGRTYRVQFRTNVSDAAWADLPGDVVATEATATKQDAAATNETRRVYRVLLVP